MIKDAAPGYIKDNYEEVIPGFYNVPIDMYHTFPGVSSSNIGDIYYDVEAYANGECLSEGPSPDVALVGNMIHEMLMFPDAAKDKYIAFEGKVRRGKKWDEFNQECEENELIPVTQSMWDLAIKVLDEVGGHHKHDTIFNPDDVRRECELSAWFFDDSTGILCKFRPDVMHISDNDIYIYDIKTTPTAEWVTDGSNKYQKGFKYSVRKYHYYRQQAFYVDGVSSLGYNPIGFDFFVVGKDVIGNRIHTLGHEWVGQGRKEYKDALYRLKKELISG